MTEVDDDLLAAAIQAQADGTLKIAAGAASSAFASDAIDATAHAGARLWDRAGLPVGGADVFTIDYGSSLGVAISGTILQELLDDGFLGVAADFTDGTPAYDPPTAEDRGHVPHGGNDRTKGIRAAAAEADAFLTTALHEEYLIGSVDAAEDGHHGWPDLFLAAEEAVQSLGVTDVTPESRNPSTPIWSLLYASRAVAGRLVAPLTTEGLSGNLIHGDDAGLSADQQTELIAYQFMSLTVAGMTPMLQTAAESFAHRIQPDAQERALPVIRDCFEALMDRDGLAGWLSCGYRQLPLVQQAWNEHNGEHNGEHGPGMMLGANPFAPVASCDSDIWQRVLPPAMQAHLMAFRDFPVLRALHSVWKNADGDVLVFLANWTLVDASGAAGTFCPWLYWQDCGEHNLEHSAEHDLVTPFRVDVIALDGTATELATGCSDALNLLCSGTAGALSGQDLSLGAVPALSTLALRFREE